MSQISCVQHTCSNVHCKTWCATYMQVRKTWQAYIKPGSRTQTQTQQSTTYYKLLYIHTYVLHKSNSTYYQCIVIIYKDDCMYIRIWSFIVIIAVNSRVFTPCQWLLATVYHLSVITGLIIMHSKYYKVYSWALLDVIIFMLFQNNTWIIFKMCWGTQEDT